jgi:magnesium transporter
VITAYTLQDGVLQTLPIADLSDIQQTVWIDLTAPTDDERQLIEAISQQHLPTSKEVREIEASARIYEDEESLHIYSFFFQQEDHRAMTTAVAFTLKGNRVISLHDQPIALFRLLRLRARRERELIQDSLSLLLALFELKVEHLADQLEATHLALETISQTVLAEEDRNLQGAINSLTRQEDANGKVRLCLMDTQRALTFLLRWRKGDEAARVWMHEILHDIDSLLPHNAFLFEKVNFLMDAAMGLINIEQNQIIKTFSIAAVVFLPPTLIASIYGMNFDVMPELHWRWGYLLALAAMLFSAITPYIYFKRKGWF